MSTERSEARYTKSAHVHGVRQRPGSRSWPSSLDLGRFLKAVPGPKAPVSGLVIHAQWRPGKLVPRPLPQLQNHRVLGPGPRFVWAIGRQAHRAHLHPYQITEILRHRLPVGAGSAEIVDRLVRARADVNEQIRLPMTSASALATSFYAQGPSTNQNSSHWKRNT